MLISKPVMPWVKSVLRERNSFLNLVAFKAYDNPNKSMREMETQTSNWIAEIIAMVAIVCGLVGAWIKDRMGVAHRLTKLETQQQIIVGESKATREQLQALNETLLKVLVEKQTK